MMILAPFRSRSLASLGATAGVQQLITAAATQYGVPTALALAVANKESSFSQTALGAKGEVGVFQLMPATAAGLGVNPYDLNQNIDGGVRMLSQLYQQYGSWNQALIAYNEGSGNLATRGVFPAAANYATSILAAAGMDNATSPVDASDGETAPDGADLAAAPVGLSPALVAAGILGALLLARLA